MSVFGRLYRAETAFDFVGRRRRWFTISAALIVISIASLALRGLNLSVDFEGGTVIETANPADASLAEVRSALADVGQAGARVQLVNDGEEVRVQTAALDIEAEEELLDTVLGVTGADAPLAVRSVGPTFGDQITESALRALVVFLIVVTLFIAWRFEWKMALAALAALFHDLLITAGVYSITGFEVTPATVIAILTILGYSLYDTVVVFDKMLEEIQYFGEDKPLPEIINLSMNLVLMRSIGTSLTSLLPVGSLLFIGSFLLGAATLREFALALFVGIAAGTYSSIFVASPLVAMWKSTEAKWQRAERKALRRDDEPADAEDKVDRGTDRPPSRPEVAATVRAGTGAVARPPKRRKKR